MAAMRKSAVSVPITWFWRNSQPTLGRRRSRKRGATINSKSTLPERSPMVSPKRQRRSLKTTNSLQELASPKVEQSRNQARKVKSNYVNIPVVPTAEALPHWLLRLQMIHRYSSVAAFLLVTVALVVYGWTVYSQELWNQQFRRLQHLQRNERQLTTTNAMLKKKMAEEAEKPSAGLVSPTPDKTIFLPSAPNTANATPSRPKPSSPTQQPTSSPLGY